MPGLLERIYGNAGADRGSAAKTVEYLQSDAIQESPTYQALKLGVQVLDPTGISSYGDVYDAGKEMWQDPSWGNAGNLLLETAGALPVVGKLGKAAKGVRTLANISGDGSTFYRSLRNMAAFNTKLDRSKDIIKAAEYLPRHAKRSVYFRPRAPYQKWEKTLNPRLSGHQFIPEDVKKEAARNLSNYKQAKTFKSNNNFINSAQYGTRAAANLDDGLDILDVGKNSYL